MWDAIDEVASTKDGLVVDKVVANGQLIDDKNDDTVASLELEDGATISVTMRQDDYCYCADCKIRMRVNDPRQLCGKTVCNTMDRL